MGGLIVNLDDALQIFAVLLLQVPDRGAFIRRMLQVLLKELQPGAVLLDQLAPSLDPDGDVVLAVNQLPGRIGAALGRTNLLPPVPVGLVGVMAQVRTVVPNVRYTVDDRLNIIMAEGSAADIDRLTKILQSSSAK